MSCRCELSGVSVLFGNKVSHSQHKTRKCFKLNMRVVRFQSELTGQTYKLRIAAKTLRSVEKIGGFDQFITNAYDELLSCKAKIIKRKIVNKRLAGSNV